MTSTRRIALVGEPVGGSVSPAMHNAAFGAMALPFEYVLHPVPRGDLAAAFPGLRERYAGLNVTTPHKEAARGLVASLGEAARACGSVNTVVFRPGEALGDSTDGAGFIRALRRGAARRALRRALVLGAGGAGRAIAAALMAEGADVCVWARDGSAARAIARDIAGVRAVSGGGLDDELRRADLLASAIPASAWSGDQPPLPPDVDLRPPLTVFDLVYRPRRTPLLDRAGRAGCVTVEGIEMLIEQGALSFSMWTGRAAPVEVMRQAAYEALAIEPVRA